MNRRPYGSQSKPLLTEPLLANVVSCAWLNKHMIWLVLTYEQYYRNVTSSWEVRTCFMVIWLRTAIQTCNNMSNGKSIYGLQGFRKKAVIWSFFYSRIISPERKKWSAWKRCWGGPPPAAASRNQNVGGRCERKPWTDASGWFWPQTWSSWGRELLWDKAQWKTMMSRKASMWIDSIKKSPRERRHRAVRPYCAHLVTFPLYCSTLSCY